MASAGASYFAAYGSAVLGLLAFFEPTGLAALAALAAAVLFAALTTVLLVTSPPEAPRLA